MESKMTAEQVQEKFGNTILRFSRYYKYTFTFRGDTNDGYKILCYFGGSSDDIYRYEVNANDENRVGSIDDWAVVRVLGAGDKVVFEQYNDW